MITTLTTAIDVTIPVKGGAQRITINNGYCYVCSYANGITIIDMQALGGPQIVGNYSKYYANTITFRDKRAYLGAGDDGFILLDVSDPIKLLFIKQWKLPSTFVTQVDSSNGFVFVAGLNRGFYVLEMVNSSPGLPLRFAIKHAESSLKTLRGVRAKGSKYVVASAALVGSPLFENRKTNLGNIGSSEELVFGEGTDDHIYSVESTAHRFEIYTSVSNPKRVFVASKGTTVSVAVRGTLAYVATKEKGLCIYTVRDPSAASILSCTAMPSGTVAGSVAVDRNSDTVAVSLGANGIRFLNLNNNSTLSPTDVPTQLPIPVTEVPTTPIPNGGTRSPTDVPTQLPIPVTEVPTTPIPNGGTRSPTDVPTQLPATAIPETEVPTTPTTNTTTLTTILTFVPTSVPTVTPNLETNTPTGIPPHTISRVGTHSPDNTSPNLDESNSSLITWMAVLIGLFIVTLIILIVYCCLTRKRDSNQSTNTITHREESEYFQMQQIQPPEDGIYQLQCLA